MPITRYGKPTYSSKATTSWKPAAKTTPSKPGTLLDNWVSEHWVSMTPEQRAAYQAGTFTIPGGEAPTAAAGGSAAPGAMPAAMPLDPTWEAQQAILRRNLKTGDAWDTYAEANLENEFGYGTDTSNPYSRAKLLQQSYQRAQRANTNSYAAQGQLYAGSLQNAQDFAKQNYLQDDDAARRAFANARNNLLKGKIDRYGQAGVQMDDQDLQKILRALGAV